MIRTILRLVYLALTLVSIALLISPETVLDAVETLPPISTGTARMAGFAGMFIFFALLSGQSRFGQDAAAASPKVQVEHLLQLVPPDIATLLKDPEVLRRVVGFAVEGRKIEAIKALRTAARTDLKDAKEMVERIQVAVRQTQS